jgi:uncharacterized protein
MDINKAPGVYKREIFLPLQPLLPTGVPGFVGFVESDKTGSSSNGPSKPIALHRNSDFEVSFKRLSTGYLADAVAGFFLNEGARCYVVAVEWNAEWESKARGKVLQHALDILAPLTDLDLIAVPDAMILTISRDSQKIDSEAVTLLQREMLEHCRRNVGRMAILDALPGQDEAEVKHQRINISAGFSGPVDGALYYPWIKTSKGVPIPPSGHVAGVFARSDARAGVFRAPANEEIRGALDLERLVTNGAQSSLNSDGINCLRAFPGRGIRVWGARTLSRDAEWRYINVRRLFLTLQRWIDLNMGWASFEPNTPQLWVRIAREITSYLVELWRAGALAGQTVDEAFYIKCDSETNPQEVVEAGQTITEIGLAPIAPAEFIMVRIVHHTAVEPR